jgi:hypothetical protein
MASVGTHPLGHHVLHGLATPVGGDQLIQVLLKVGRRQRQAVVHPERRLIERQLPDPDPGRGGL